MPPRGKLWLLCDTAGAASGPLARVSSTAVLVPHGLEEEEGDARPETKRPRLQTASTSPHEGLHT
ncbi:hypothetical protein EYF80_036921 [Liparis tanakae]|uniref:Uncharacterized protein n=1 Tax=Liparis tanakae TaxID=230148 RepID=A0A4Z2GH82_9TELE|nr:hypothetical protein EYF80_036921 [Liparis tanakae]